MSHTEFSLWVGTSFFFFCCMHSLSMCVIVRASERGGRGVNDPGAHGLQRGPIMGPLASHADFSVSFRCLFFFGNHLIAIGKTVRISVKTFFFFIFGDLLIPTGKTVRISVKTLFFSGDHIIFWTKLRHFLRLFWSSQNWKFVTFVLAPGLRSALGAPGYSALGLQALCRKILIAVFFRTIAKNKEFHQSIPKLE